MFQEVAPAAYSLFLENQSSFIPASEATGDVDYHVFAVAGDSVFGDDGKWKIDIDIPIGPVILQLRGFIDKKTLNAVITAYIKLPFLPAIRIGEFKGSLLHGITISVKIPKVSGSISLFVQNKALWIKFDLTVFGKHFGATLKLLPLPFLLSGEFKDAEYENVLKGFEATSIEAAA